MCEWKWIVREIYNAKAKPPHVPGQLALQTKHETDWSKDLEVQLAEKRGNVDVIVTAFPHLTCKRLMTEDEILNIFRHDPLTQTWWGRAVRRVRRHRDNRPDPGS